MEIELAGLDFYTWVPAGTSFPPCPSHPTSFDSHNFSSAHSLAHPASHPTLIPHNNITLTTLILDKLTHSLTHSFPNFSHNNHLNNTYLKVARREVQESKGLKSEGLKSDEVEQLARGFERADWLSNHTYPMFTFMELLTSLWPFFTAAAVIVLSLMVKERIPEEVCNFLFFIFEKCLCMPQLNLIIIEQNCGMDRNQIYEATTTYLRTIIRDSTSPKFLKVSKTIKQKRATADIVVGESVIDSFGGIKTLKWKLCAEKDADGDDLRYFVLSFDKKFKEFVLDSYLSHVLSRSEALQKAEREVKLYSRECGHGGGEWGFIILEHPATFEKLAMDPEQKRKLIDDLKKFVERKELHQRVGKAWKRGYLIHGPPGTGVAIRVRVSGSCRVNSYFSLSGLLNVIDGLWSSCGDEWIIVFTTNHKDRLDMLDPALSRPGRIDMHVYMSYCTMDGFKLLASTYLRIEDDHELYGQIEGLLRNVKVTPAEIAEMLLKSDNPDGALGGVVKFQNTKECGGGGGGDRHVLYMDTAVKYGVLVRVGGGVVGASVKKLDLKKMIEELDLYEVLLLSQMLVVTIDLPDDAISLHLHQLSLAFRLYCQSLSSMRLGFLLLLEMTRRMDN
ncbi:hypothetical protein SO802_030808 [Lithocarpus litseifolius]|uniref:ATPase AAA-type core domain-containing protein n=1 Tax=Lithocarpus litseifolius TaxID=425828 RepID=A0AAW2BJC2_9ROSI